MAAQDLEPALGRLAGFNAEGAPLVQLAGERLPRPARASVLLEPAHVDCEVTLLVQNPRGESRLVVTGVLFGPAVVGEHAAGTRSREVILDGERLVFTAERELVLRCGDAQIVLRADGKALVKGRELVHVASGTNRIRGATVSIN